MIRMRHRIEQADELVEQLREQINQMKPPEAQDPWDFLIKAHKDRQKPG
jgi:hypothetical protein